MSLSRDSLHFNSLLRHHRYHHNHDCWRSSPSLTKLSFQRFCAGKEMSLLYAAAKGFVSMCRQLLAAGGDVEERSPRILATPLHLAATYGHQRIIQLLLSHKADVNSRSRTEATPLHLASQEGHLASVVTLLQAGADPLLPKHDGQLPIHLAAQRNHVEVVRILIEQGGCSPDQVRHTALQSIDFHLEKNGQTSDRI